MPTDDKWSDGIDGQVPRLIRHETCRHLTKCIEIKTYRCKGYRDLSGLRNNSVKRAAIQCVSLRFEERGCCEWRALCERHS